MFSVYGDTIFDPFMGTGTTNTAAVLSGRSSIGNELDNQLFSHFGEQLTDAESLAEDLIKNRINRYKNIITDREQRGKEIKYRNENLNIKAVTSQEQHIRFYVPVKYKKNASLIEVLYNEYKQNS